MTIQHNGTTRKLTPLLMKDFLVAQTLKGLKTQTRRLNGLEEINEKPNKYQKVKFNEQYGKNTWIFFGKSPIEILAKAKCPYGKIGDVIWVREIHRLYSAVKHTTYEGNVVWKHIYEYKADGDSKSTAKWKPSIHMPKEACRLFLEITDIRPERLQDITEEDAELEGVEFVIEDDETWFLNYKANNYVQASATYSFKSLWESINGGDSWNLNPWVWRISFKVIPKPANWPA